ncbi:glycosyltransferase family 2 protein [Ligilactobacillus salivarius]|uniref:glycosyltransferase family 2 protein n=1 Tax=Ligilactobacillus salivarius TaxID=1624 RepID=UPI00136D4144|nr:glycosyltransferase family 2 protein [Ligilactobacillus salivarius]MBS5941120.1 glycosyltransferase family 2 protein [Ligilactobacillus salivarius]MYY52673.1 glycosyltransferase family 2 protein [Ligilactobacillus salivarius]
MKISLLMATYNGEKYIVEQLKSIYNQTVNPDEVLIADDVSNDRTVELIEKFIEQHDLKNWKLMINSSNKGYKKNFYDLIQQATGDVIFLSDQDDVWEKNKIELMTKELEKNAKIKSINAAVKYVDSEQSPIEVKLKPDFYNENLLHYRGNLGFLTSIPLASMIVANITPGCAMCFSKDIKEEFLETYDFTLPHDWHLNLLASIHGGCFFMNKVLVKYRIHANNAIGTKYGSNLRELILNYDRTLRSIGIKENLDILEVLREKYNFNDNSSLQAINYLETRYRFYKRPTIYKYFKMKSFPEYEYTTNKKGRLWDLLAVTGITDLAFKIVKN